jgi:hypothetical protein
MTNPSEIERPRPEKKVEGGQSPGLYDGCGVGDVGGGVEEVCVEGGAGGVVYEAQQGVGSKPQKPRVSKRRERHYAWITFSQQKNTTLVMRHSVRVRDRDPPVGSAQE